MGESCGHLERHMTPCEPCAKVDPWGCDEVLFVKTSFGYGIAVKDGGSSSVAISFCPFCGERLDGSGGWRDAEQEKPKEGETVLVATVNEENGRRMIELASHLEGSGWMIYYDRVTHWMPTPELPKSEESTG